MVISSHASLDQGGMPLRGVSGGHVCHGALRTSVLRPRQQRWRLSQTKLRGERRSETATRPTQAPAPAHAAHGWAWRAPRRRLVPRPNGRHSGHRRDSGYVINCDAMPLSSQPRRLTCGHSAAEHTKIGTDSSPRECGQHAELIHERLLLDFHRGALKNPRATQEHTDQRKSSLAGRG